MSLRRSFSLAISMHNRKRLIASARTASTGKIQLSGSSTMCCLLSQQTCFQYLTCSAARLQSFLRSVNNGEEASSSLSNATLGFLLSSEIDARISPSKSRGCRGANTGMIPCSVSRRIVCCECCTLRAESQLELWKEPSKFTRRCSVSLQLHT